MRKIIFITLSLFTNYLYASPTYLICIDTIPINGIYRKVPVVFDESKKTIQISGVDGSITSINKTSIIADAFGFTHVIDRISSQMTVFQPSETKYQFIFNCSLSKKTEF